MHLSDYKEIILKAIVLYIFAFLFSILVLRSNVSVIGVLFKIMLNSIYTKIYVHFFSYNFSGVDRCYYFKK